MPETAIAPAAPAPVTPSPAPAPAPPAPAPAPAPKPAPAQAPAPNSHLKEPFAELDKLAGRKPAKAEPSSDEDDAPVEADKPAEPAEPTEIEAGLTPPQKKEAHVPKVATLRAAYEKSKGELETLRKQLQEREHSLAEMKKQFDEFKTKPQTAPEVESLKKRNGELEEAIKYADWRKSREYEERFKRPIEQAYQAALEEVVQLPIDGDDRKATDRDFIDILQSPAGEAARKAAELFGPAAPIVLQHRSAVIRATAQRNQAEKEFQGSMKQREEQMSSAAEQVYGVFRNTSAELTKKFPELFSYDAEKDKDLAEAFAAGEKLADTAFLGFGDGENAPDAPMKRAKVQAAVRMRAAALVPTLMKLRKAEEEISGLKERLKSYERAEPSGGTRTDPVGEKPKSWEEEIDALAGRRR